MAARTPWNAFPQLLTIIIQLPVTSYLPARFSSPYWMQKSIRRRSGSGRGLCHRNSTSNVPVALTRAQQVIALVTAGWCYHAAVRRTLASTPFHLRIYPNGPKTSSGLGFDGIRSAKVATSSLDSEPSLLVSRYSNVSRCCCPHASGACNQHKRGRFRDVHFHNAGSPTFDGVENRNHISSFESELARGDIVTPTLDVGVTKCLGSESAFCSQPLARKCSQPRASQC